MDALIATARRHFHERLFETETLTVSPSGIASNADADSRPSKAISGKLMDILSGEQGHSVKVMTKINGQTAGGLFESCVMEYLRETFPYMQNICPGTWHVVKLGNNNRLKTSDFAQYEHLATLDAIVKENPGLRAALEGAYIVSPDVVVYRDLYGDEKLNEGQILVDDTVAVMADIRRGDGKKPILHANVSAKLTMRTDRAQNSRTEALNMIRNRKGHLPHIVVVTAEPLPTRIASLALGTGDIDCVYHFALYELARAIENVGSDDAKEMLTTLVDGKRLKDISDLPLDLTT